MGTTLFLNEKARRTEEEIQKSKKVLPILGQAKNAFYSVIYAHLVNKGVNPLLAMRIAHRCRAGWLFHGNESPRVIIMDSFTWEGSPEGYSFWSEIHSAFYQGNLNPNVYY
jgi:hypothetical protein